MFVVRGKFQNQIIFILYTYIDLKQCFIVNICFLGFSVLFFFAEKGEQPVLMN